MYDKGDFRVSESYVSRPNRDQLRKMQILGLQLGIQSYERRSRIDSLLEAQKLHFAKLVPIGL